MNIKELKAKREELVKKNRREYTTMGNTQRCQELWAEIEKIDDQIKKGEKMKEEAKKAWAYMRFGTAGDCVKNDTNGREIVRTSRHTNTLWFECNCYENGEYKGREYGRDAIKWLVAEERSMK